MKIFKIFKILMGINFGVAMAGVFSGNHWLCLIGMPLALIFCCFCMAEN